MIFGYISTKQYLGIEETLTKDKPEANIFEFGVGNRRAFFFQYSPNKLNRLTYRDANRLLLCDGIPIRRSPDKGYEIVDSLSAKDIQNGFTSLIDDIVSNVSMLFFDLPWSIATV